MTVAAAMSFGDDEDAAHLEHPDPAFQSVTTNYRDIPDGVNVPDPASILPSWHLWSLAVLTLVTVATAVLAGSTALRQRSSDHRLTSNVAGNTDIICRAARIRQSTPAVTETERLMQHLMEPTDKHCIATRKP